MPLELFVFAGSFLEEAISPIPSFVVMIPAGAAARVQGEGWWYLAELAFLAACGRIIAAVALYALANKAEGWLLGKGRRLFGIDHKQLVHYGRWLNQSWRGWVLLFALNAIPILPTAGLSLACGFVKVRFVPFAAATFLGTAVNAFLYMGAAYLGLQAISDAHLLERSAEIALAVIVAGCIALFVARRKASIKRTLDTR